MSPPPPSGLRTVRVALILSLLGAAVLGGCVHAGDPAAARSSPRSDQCRFDAPPIVLIETGDAGKPGSELLQVWTTRDLPKLWKAADGLPDQSAFAAKARAKLGNLDPVDLLRQNKTPNNVLVGSLIRRWVTPIRCIEWLQFEYQDARVSVLERPTEFLSYVLRSADGRMLKIIYYTKNEDGIGRFGPLSDALDAATSEGWQAIASLHSHNFHPSKPAMNGILAPSGPDSQLYKAQATRIGLEEAWITNGLHTFRMPARDFSMLSEIEAPVP